MLPCTYATRHHCDTVTLWHCNNAGGVHFDAGKRCIFEAPRKPRAQMLPSIARRAHSFTEPHHTASLFSRNESIPSLASSLFACSAMTLPAHSTAS